MESSESPLTNSCVPFFQQKCRSASSVLPFAMQLSPLCAGLPHKRPIAARFCSATPSVANTRLHLLRQNRHNPSQVLGVILVSGLWLLVLVWVTTTSTFSLVRKHTQLYPGCTGEGELHALEARLYQHKSNTIPSSRAPGPSMTQKITVQYILYFV